MMLLSGHSFHTKRCLSGILLARFPALYVGLGLVLAVCSGVEGLGDNGDVSNR